MLTNFHVFEGAAEAPVRLADGRDFSASLRPTGATWMFRTHRGPINVDVPTKLAANDTSMLFAATCAGNGIAILSTYVAKAAFRSGELVPLFPEFPLQETWLKALVPKRKVGTRRIDTLLTWLKEHLSPVPPWERV